MAGSNGDASSMAAVRGLGRTFQALQRVSRAVPQFGTKEGADGGATPTLRKAKIAMVVHAATSVVERNTIQILVNGYGERQGHIEFELV
jgi:hypothetical protein